MSVNSNPPVTICNCAAVREAARATTRFYDQALAPFGLRITQYSILSRLAAGPATVSGLAERMLLDRATMGHDLRPLEAAGLVASRPGTDRRSRVVTLTEAGQAARERARPAWQAAQAAFEAAFGAEDAAAMRRIMARVARLSLPVDGNDKA